MIKNNKLKLSTQSNEIQSNIKNSDLKETNKGLDDNNNGELRPDSIMIRKSRLIILIMDQLTRNLVNNEEMMESDDEKQQEINTSNWTIPDQILNESYNSLVVKDCRKSRQIDIFRQNFKNWTSGNSEVDELIQNSHLEATVSLNYFELIDHKEIVNIEYVTKGGLAITLKELENQEKFNSIF
ncbi:hypothetical protein C1646_766493 [Rhizophagus diaphanus]|nr:hypothetical protein C1646_766493 [Rhizophagus diaphanus] [Rhizophagus sp. MUCL 43196]